MPKPDYTEDFVAMMISSYLMSSSNILSPLFLNPISRQLENKEGYGYDAELTHRLGKFKPIYMQFKRPKNIHQSATKINKARIKAGAKTTPETVSFELLRTSGDIRKSQHNILFKKSKNYNAVYICPVYQSACEYQLMINTASYFNRIYSLNPMRYIKYSLFYKSKKFKNLPTIPGHIAITPHREISTLPHEYSFTSKLEDVCFHSQTERVKNYQSLDDYLEKILYNEDKYEAFSFIDSRNVLEKLINISFGEESKEYRDIFKYRSGFVQWIKYGELLLKHHDIHQFIYFSKE